MSDSDNLSTPATLPSIDAVQPGKIVSVGQNKVLEMPNLPKAPNSLEWKDKGLMGRAQRVKALEAQLNAEDDVEVADKIAGGGNQIKEDTELDAGVAKAEEKAKEAGAITTETSPEEDADKEEKRRESRRAEAEAKLKGDDAPAAAEAEAEPGAQADAEAEPDAKAEKKPETASDKERRERFAAVLKLEAQANKQNEKLRQREDGLKRQEKDFAAKQQEFYRQWRQQAAQYDQDIQVAKQVLKLARENPLELLERAGQTPDQVGKWIADASDPVNTMRRQMDARFAELEARERQMQQQEAQRREQARVAETRQQIESQFLEHFSEKDGDEFLFEPARLIYSRSELIRLGNEIADDAVRMGQQFTTRDIAEAINEVAKGDERYKQIMARASTKPAADAKPAPKPSTAQSPKTVTAAPAAQRANSTPKPTVAITNSAAQDSAPAAKTGPNRNYKDQRNNRLRKMFAGLDRE